MPARLSPPRRAPAPDPALSRPSAPAMSSEPLNNATPTELFLITSAVALSVLLAIFATPLVATALSSFNPLLEYVSLHLLSSATLTHVVVSLRLLYRRRLSLDTFAVSLVGLLPAVQAVERMPALLKRARARSLMRRRRVLHGRLSRFRYLRRGYAPRLAELAAHGLASAATAYIRAPAAARTRLLGLRLWHGEVTAADDAAVHLRDTTNVGDATRWWRAANDAVALVEDPHRASLPSREAALAAIELLAEMASVGHVVLDAHGAALRAHLGGSPGVRNALSASPASVCNDVVRAVGLDRAWGCVDAGVADRFCRDDESGGLPRAAQYAVLYFILLHRTHIFSETRAVDNTGCRLPDALDVVHCYATEPEEDKRTNVTARWLMRWGFEDAAVALGCD